jgi:alkylation response protein AidB-like acyl-CoA dehydrogenase
MDFALTEEQKLLRATVREYAESEIAPVLEQYEREAKFPREVVMRLWEELGLGGMLCSEEYGGIGLEAIAYTLVIEELARVWPSLSIIVSVHNSVGVRLIARQGSEEQKRKYLPRLARDWVAAFSLSEAGAGSDVAAMRAGAVRDGDEYVLSGEKNWVTNGLHADLYVIFVKTDPEAGSRGITAFLVEKGTPGLLASRPERKMGIKASEAVVLSLDQVRVPVANRLGEEGAGFKIAMMQLDGGRVGVGAQALGIAQAALEKAVRYAREREAFGKPIAELQAIQWMLADMAVRVEAARLLVYRAAWLRQQDKPFTRAASMAKLFASEAATYVTHRAIQVHGGYGYTEDYQVERFYRDARVTEIYEGTSEIQRLVIARNWLREQGFED